MTKYLKTLDFLYVIYYILNSISHFVFAQKRGGRHVIELNQRHHQILEIVKVYQPISSNDIAKHLGVTRAAIRADLKVLVLMSFLEAKPKVGYCLVEAKRKKAIDHFLMSILVKDCFSVPIVVDQKVSLYEAIVTMFLEDVGTIFVTDADYLVGVVSRKDLLKVAIGGGDLESMPISLAMTRMPNVIITHATSSIAEAAQKIVLHQIDALPVVNEYIKGERVYYKVVGRFSKTNLAELFVKFIDDKREV